MSILNIANPKAISIFTGAGGLDMGFERAGFSIVSALELHPKYCETIKENQARMIKIPGTDRTYFQNTVIFNDDICNVSGHHIACGESEIDCLIGGPPCQAFSSAGKQLSIFDHRGALVYEYLRVLRELNPKTFLFENVRGLVTARGKKNEPGEIMHELLDKFSEAGYNCRVALLNAAEFGSYQRRVRCFIIGSRIAAAPYFPIPEYAEEEKYSLLPEDCRKKWHTLGEFLEKYSDSDMSEWTRPTAELETMLSTIPAGSGIKSAGRVEATRPGGHWGYRQGTFIADPNKPARTVTGSASQDWIRLADGTLRRLTLLEVSRLQGFPDEWCFCGSKADQFQQVGNAVPSAFGEVLGRTLAEYVTGGYMSYPKSNETTIPKDIEESIRYTKYDNAKNGAYRANVFVTE